MELLILKHYWTFLILEIIQNKEEKKTLKHNTLCLKVGDTQGLTKTEHTG